MNRMKREYSDIGGIQQQAADIIRQAYDKGYKAGYVDGKDEAYKNPVPTQDAYNDGLRDAWECARKIAIINNGISDEQLTEIFGTDDTLKIFDQFSASEAIAKIKEYKEKQKQFAVGDEVYSDAFDDKGIITYITADKISCVCIICSGSTMMKVGTIGLHKTGRHFPQIAKVLEQMKRG